MLPLKLCVLLTIIINTNGGNWLRDLMTGSNDYVRAFIINSAGMFELPKQRGRFFNFLFSFLSCPRRSGVSRDVGI